MKIGVIGTGYVGLVTGACLAEVGHQVICMDNDQDKIAQLKAGRVPIYEPGLPQLVARNVAEDRLAFTGSLEVALASAEIIFLAVGTPETPDGTADLSMVLSVARDIGGIMTNPLIVVQKSTCPVGTSSRIKEIIAAELSARHLTIRFDVAVNPEFLREGAGVRDFMEPDRVIIGSDDTRTVGRLVDLYAPIIPRERVHVMDTVSAELTKHASNAFLATKISFINEIANLCEAVGGDVEAIRRGMGADHRIGPAFLAAGIGYGGSCFPKDINALISMGRKHGSPLYITEAVQAANQRQVLRQVEKVIGHFGGELVGRKIAVWGLAFKPETDDVRQAPAIQVVQALLRAGAQVTAFDPVATANAQRLLGDEVSFANTAIDCVTGADALLLVTEWKEFQEADLETLRDRMAGRVMFDFRNAFAPDSVVRAGFVYYGVGRMART